MGNGAELKGLAVRSLNLKLAPREGAAGMVYQLAQVGGGVKNKGGRGLESCQQTSKMKSDYPSKYFPILHVLYLHLFLFVRNSNLNAHLAFLLLRNLAILSREQKEKPASLLGSKSHLLQL